LAELSPSAEIDTLPPLTLALDGAQEAPHTPTHDNDSAATIPIKN
jgi:hypothetical protein